jgi:hypothetical protein
MSLEWVFIGLFSGALYYAVVVLPQLGIVPVSLSQAVFILGLVVVPGGAILILNKVEAYPPAAKTALLGGVIALTLQMLVSMSKLAGIVPGEAAEPLQLVQNTVIGVAGLSIVTLLLQYTYLRATKKLV